MSIDLTLIEICLRGVNFITIFIDNLMIIVAVKFLFQIQYFQRKTNGLFIYIHISI